MNAIPSSATKLHRLGGLESAPAVVFIHGFGADRFAWAANAPQLFERYDVYALELPGHGGAGLLGSLRPELGELAAGALQAIATSKIAGKYALIGHSLGGAVALEMGRQAPGRIGTILVIAPAGFGTSVDVDFVEGLPELQNEAEALTLLEKLVANPRHVGPAMAGHLLAGLGKPGRRDDLRALAHMIKTLEPGAIPALPITWIWGEKDRISPLDKELMDRQGGNFERIEAAGHMPQIEKAQAVNRIVAAVLKGWADGASAL